MYARTKAALTAAALAAVALVAGARAADAEASAVSKITVKGLSCPSCAKKVTGRIKEVVGVADAAADVETGVVTVTPKDGQSPSPLSLWEAVEKAKYTPTRLEGPGGTFTEKPKS